MNRVIVRGALPKQPYSLSIPRRCAHFPVPSFTTPAISTRIPRVHHGIRNYSSSFPTPIHQPSRLRRARPWIIGLVAVSAVLLVADALIEVVLMDEETAELTDELYHLQERMDRVHRWAQDRESLLQIRSGSQSIPAISSSFESGEEASGSLDPGLIVLQSQILAYNRFQESLTPLVEQMHAHLAQGEYDMEQLAKEATRLREEEKADENNPSLLAIMERAEDYLLQYAQEMRGLVREINQRYDEFEALYFAQNLE